MKDYGGILQGYLGFTPSSADQLTAFEKTSLVLILLVISFQLTLKLFRKLQKQNEPKAGLERIPQLRPLFPLKLIGNLPLLLPISQVMEKAKHWCTKFGDAWRFTGACENFVIFNQASLVQTLLKSGNFDHGFKSPVLYDLMQPLITTGVLVSTGTFWQGQRRILMRTQSFSRMKSYMSLLNKHGKRMVEQLEEIFSDGKPNEINVLINAVFLKIITEMITGFDLSESDEFDRYHHNFQIWKEIMIKRFYYPWLQYKPIWRWHPMKRRNDKAVGELIEFARNRISEREQKKAEESVNNDPASIDTSHQGSSFRSVLDELVDAGVDEHQILEEVNTMLFGGHETGATVIHFFCFAMALNQDVQKKCQQEIDELLENDVGNELAYDVVQAELKYLERCILETMRLFPPVFLYIRQLKSPLKIEYKDRPIVLPAGTNAVVFPFTLHRKPEYFPEPEKFDPDRFLPEEIAKRHAYSYIPFSAGPRNCLGIKFAMLEMKVISTYILRNFTISTSDTMENVPLLPWATLTPAKDYTFRFKKRAHKLD